MLTFYILAFFGFYLYILLLFNGVSMRKYNQKTKEFSSIYVWLGLFVILNIIFLWASYSQTYFKIAPIEVSSESIFISEVNPENKFAFASNAVKNNELYKSTSPSVTQNQAVLATKFFNKYGSDLEKGYVDSRGVKHNGQTENWITTVVNDKTEIALKQANYMQSKAYQKAQKDAIGQAWVFLILVGIWIFITAFFLEGGEKRREYNEKEKMSLR